MRTATPGTRKYLKHVFLGFVTAAAAFFLFSAAALPKTVLADEPAAQTSFSVSASDANGWQFQGRQNPADGTWYLFLPGGVNISTIALHYTGAVLETSGGVLDAASCTVSGCFAKNKDEILLRLPESEVRVKVMQSSLPGLQIILNNTSLPEVHKDKNKKYANNSIILTDAGGNVQLSAANCVELKGRGNSSWRLYEKKGYQIKFSEKTPVLGMPDAKKWVLLANSSDDSMIRNMLGFDLSRRMEMPYTTSYQYIDLWIGGDYRGTYLIGEKIEIGKSRVNLTDDKGLLLEQDDAFYNEEDYWFYDEFLGTHFAVKETVNEKDKAVINSAIEEFHSSLDAFMQYIYQTPAQDISLQSLNTMIDVDSFAKYYLINEYTMNRESNCTSLYWYKNGPGDVMHLGPVWDFDTCMGNDGPGYTEYHAVNASPLFNRLLSIPAFYNRTTELKNTYRSAFKGMTGRADAFCSQIAASAEMNYLRWNVLGTPNPKTDIAFCNTWQDADAQVKGWLSGRYNAFQTVKPCLQTQISEDAQNLIITAQPSGSYAGLQLAIWSAKDGQDDLKWYPAEKQGNQWVCTVNLNELKDKGIYMIHAYGNREGVSTFLSGAFFYR